MFTFFCIAVVLFDEEGDCMHALNTGLTSSIRARASREETTCKQTYLSSRTHSVGHFLSSHCDYL